MSRQNPMITVSIVSHNHGSMVNELIKTLLQCDSVTKIILTRNVPETIPAIAGERIVLIENRSPRGFGANHNTAFRRSDAPYFCVLNPDIEFPNDPFPALINTLEDQNAALVGPQILSQDGYVEDSIRHFPTLRSLALKLLLKDEGRYAVAQDAKLIFPEWIAGMFMLFRSADYEDVRGFDERYYLYYEDVDICARLQQAGKKIVADLSVNVTHNARRKSRKDLRHMRWHFTSMLRYLWAYRTRTILPAKRGEGH